MPESHEERVTTFIRTPNRGVLVYPTGETLCCGVHNVRNVVV